MTEIPGQRELFPGAIADQLDELNANLPTGYHAWRWAGRFFVRRERSSPAWVVSRQTAAEIRSAVDEHETGKETTP